MGDIFGSSILTNILLIFILMTALYIANILIDFKEETNDGREVFKKCYYLWRSCDAGNKSK